jgi:MoaA/NifB/PqqE/SkfB family radical SAM enzyme
MIWGNSDNVDLYINYNCDLRCNHCFVGDMLTSKMEMPFEVVKAIINESYNNGIATITLLGGEPCLHSNILDIVEYIYVKGLRLRIVTNGQKSFLKFINVIDEELREYIHVCFSIDGSRKEVHDLIRGANSFEKLCISISTSQIYGISMSGILSVSKDNYDDAVNVISFCDNNKMQYLNIHYVTNRGYAQKENVVDIHDWNKLYQKIQLMKKEIKIRIERTFVPIESEINCGVVKKENIIIDPYGRLYGCTMFLNFEGFHTATFENERWVINTNLVNENTICGKSCKSCPGIELINNSLLLDAVSNGYKIDCIFNKTSI